MVFPELNEILLAIDDGIYAVDKRRRIVFWNEGAEKLTGYSSDEALGRRCADNMLCHVSPVGKEVCVTGCPLISTIQYGIVSEAAVFLHHKRGHRLPVTVKAFPLKNADGNITGAVELFSLASSRKDVLKGFEKMQKAAFQDKMTGIGNRRFGEVTLENISQKHPQGSYGLLFVDIDHFKNVNDTWGHSTGDDVLRMVANSLNSGLRKDDSVFRWGGEEFLAVLPDCSPQELKTVGETLRMLIENSWLDHKDTILKVTASLGGAIAHKDEEIDSVLKRADEQMYLSKESGRNMVSIDEDDRNSQITTSAS